MKNILTYIILLLLVKNTAVEAQTSPTYTAITGSLVGVGASSIAVNNTINFPVTDKPNAPQSLREANTSAKLYIDLAAGNDFVKQNGAQWNFKVEMDYSYQFAGSSPVVKTLTITNTDPEILKIDNVLSAFTSSSPAFTSTISSLSITDGSGNPISGLVSDFLTKHLTLSVKLERTYKVDVRLTTGFMSNAPTIYPVSITNRLVSFSWQPNNTSPYPNYEIQILKLYNTDPTLQTNLSQISCVPDWSRALKVETQNFRSRIDLTVAEGSGFYIWRVRPVGNYFEGGISNGENYGEWSSTLPSNSPTLTLNKTAFTPTSVSFPYAFYFTDPDEDMNWIYSRVFTEGDDFDKSNPSGSKTSEGMTYADGLQRIRQVQKYNSSENINIVSQTINDHAGRPALTTIPVPVANGLTGYKLGLVTNTAGALYTAEFFDNDDNIANPEPVKDNGSSAFKYYSTNPTSSPVNSFVPSAEGYPFKRTVFTTDGTGRVAEESGVGKRHALGSQTNGMGKTTRVLYSTPTDDELIRLFGEEAPLAESVVKTITIDQNEVMSITYTSKEGKTIATALTSTSSPNLESLARSANNAIVSNSIDQNVNANGKIVSSKKISVSGSNTTFTINYSNDAMTAPGTGCGSGNCNFKMRFYLIDLKNTITYVSDADGSAGLTDFNVSGGSYVFPNGWRFVRASTNTNTLAPLTITTSGANNNEIQLNAGEYVFVKEIFSANAANYAENLINLENEKTKPIIDAIATQMQSINSTESYTLFSAFMASLTTMVNGYQTSGSPTSADLLSFLGIDPADLPPGFLFPGASDFSLSPITSSTNNAQTNDMTISTGCCGKMTIPLPKDPVCVLCEGSPDEQFQGSAEIEDMVMQNNIVSTESITPYGFNDFKGATGWNALSVSAKRAAIHDLVERELILPLKNKMTAEGYAINKDLWKIAPGFSYESLNFMFSNMLISQYFTGTAVEDVCGSGEWYEGTVLSTGGYSLAANALSLTASGYPYNYDCKNIYANWIAVVELINSYESDDGKNILNEFNDSDEPNSGQDNANDEENWEKMRRSKKKKLKKALGQELEDFSNSGEGSVPKSRQEAVAGIINTFMDNIGYQFAAIIDGTPLPKYISAINDVFPDDYNYTFTTSPSAPAYGPGIYPTITTGTLSNTYSPFLFEIDNTGAAEMTTLTCNGTVNELFYPYILKPEWMFKYYVYNVYENNAGGGFIDDADVLIPHQVTIDLQRKYNDQFSYLPGTITSTLSETSLCDYTPPLTYTSGSCTYTFQGYYHNNWTSEDRFYFYEAIKGAPRCPANKGIASTGGPGGGKDDYYTDPVNDLPVCETKSVLVVEAISELTERIEDCYNMKTAIKQALINELINACYDIVSCKSSTTQITEKEIDLMVMAVINTATTQINDIRNKFVSMTTTLSTACSPGSTTNTYTDGLCNLPSCSQADCKEVVLYNDNSIGVIDSRKIVVQYYTDCDQNILDMIENGTFLPYVTPLPGCATPPNSKPWQQSCTTNSTCNGNTPPYTEKTDCTNKEYFKYSQTFQIQATGN